MVAANDRQWQERNIVEGDSILVSCSCRKTEGHPDIPEHNTMASAWWFQRVGESVVQSLMLWTCGSVQQELLRLMGRTIKLMVVNTYWQLSSPASFARTDWYKCPCIITVPLLLLLLVNILHQSIEGGTNNQQPELFQKDAFVLPSNFQAEEEAQNIYPNQ